MSNFQAQVNGVQAPGIAGEFCSTNPRYSVLAGPGGLVAGSAPGFAGAVVARFAWLSFNVIDGDNAPAQVNNFGSGQPAGFIHREQQGLITAYLGESSLVVPTGFPITVMDAGEFWMKNDGATTAVPGMKAYANFADGKVTFAAAGAPAGATASSYTISAATFSVTGSVAGDQLTVTAVGSGSVYNGAIISGTGIATGTQIVGQVSGTPNGVGVYVLSISDQTAASTTVSGTYGLLTLTTVATGNFGVGDSLSGTGVTAGTTIGQFITGTGGTGSTAAVNFTQTASSGTLTGATNYETKWICRSTGLAGEIVKTSTVT